MMHTVIERLLDVLDTQPVPAEHMSSYWRHHERATVVERYDDQLTVKASGFDPVRRHPALAHIGAVVERFWHRGTTAGLKSYARIWRLAVRLTRDLSGSPSFNVFKNACALAVLADHWADAGLAPKTFALIGDGDGLFGALIRRWIPGARLYCIDLPKMLVFQARTHELADPAVRMSLLAAEPSPVKADVLLVPPQHLEAIDDAVDCAVNIASMQEMTPSSIAAYFTFLRRRSHAQSRFYCVNRWEKTLPGGEIVRFSEYPWQPNDDVLLDGPCPYYRGPLLQLVTRPRGPQLFGVRIPFVNDFDGVIMHRLVHLAPLGRAAG